MTTSPLHGCLTHIYPAGFIPKGDIVYPCPPNAQTRFTRLPFAPMLWFQREFSGLLIPILGTVDDMTLPETNMVQGRHVETCLFEGDHRVWTVSFQMQATLTPIPGFTLWSFLDLATWQCKHLEKSPWCQMMGVRLTWPVLYSIILWYIVLVPIKFCTLLELWESSQTFQFSSKHILWWDFYLPYHGN